MDFSDVTAVSIPEGDVNKIMQGDTVLWEKSQNNQNRTFTFTVQASNSIGKTQRILSITL